MAEVRVALGIDVGGTKVAFVLLDAEPRVLAERRLLNRQHADARALLEAVVREAVALVEERPAGSTLSGTGVGICELVDPIGEVGSATTIPWRRSDLDDALAPVGPLTVEADVRAAAVAEAVFGAGRPFPTFGYVTLGTGISSTFVRDGEAWIGAHGAAQLLGSARITLPCPHCGRMLDTSLEDVASGAGISRRYRERTGLDVAGSDEVVAAAAGGDPAAERILAEAADALGSFLALFVNLFDPHAMVLGGGLVSAETPFRDRALGAARSHIWAESACSTPLLVGELGPNAGAIGAAWSVLIREGAV
ncbi:MAG: ROK family protein [Actinomycetota bacterium]